MTKSEKRYLQDQVEHNKKTIEQVERGKGYQDIGRVRIRKCAPDKGSFPTTLPAKS